MKVVFTLDQSQLFNLFRVVMKTKLMRKGRKNNIHFIQFLDIKMGLKYKNIQNTQKQLKNILLC